MNPRTLAVVGMLAGLGIDIMDAVPRRRRSGRKYRANDGTSDAECEAEAKRARKRAKWEAECASREARKGGA